MNIPVLEKSLELTKRCNMPDYSDAVAKFSWDKARKMLDGLPNGKLNIAFEAVDRHVVHGRSDVVALRWIAKDMQRKDFTYADLTDLSNRFSNVLETLGMSKGERVFSLLGRVPQLYITVLGTLKAGCVYCPLFSAFGPEPVKSRMDIGKAGVLVTTKALYRRKVAGIRKSLPNLKHVLLIDGGSAEDQTLDFEQLMNSASSDFQVLPTDPEDMALLHFTSGTTGKPKGAIHVHEAVVAHHITGRYALDLQEGDTYWCTADPGWVTGTSYGIIAPLTNGVTMIVSEGEFDAVAWYRILQEESVNVWYTAPTAIRMLMKSGDAIPAEHDWTSLRFMASVGEPLNPEAVIWSNQVFGMPFHDNWWQTETGGIMIANYASMTVKPGSMGKPLPGITAGIIDKTDLGLKVLTKPGAVGELALRSGWPSMMRGYLDEQERYQKCFTDGWYLSGDLAMCDKDGYYWFVGRSDDVIKSAGHLIGPFEVESTLMEHEAVAEAAVIGLPDDMAGEIVKARELGLPEGDISTLESDEK